MSVRVLLLVFCHEDHEQAGGLFLFLIVSYVFNNCVAQPLAFRLDRSQFNNIKYNLQRFPQRTRTLAVPK